MDKSNWIIIIWLTIGLITSLLIMVYNWYNGCNINVSHLTATIITALCGPMFPAIIVYMYVKAESIGDSLLNTSKDDKKIILKGRTKARVLRVLREE